MLTVLKSNQLKFIQNVGKAIKGLALVLTILVPILYVLAIALARGRRRRMLMNVGLSGILGGVLVLLARSLLVNKIPTALTNDDSLQLTIQAVVAINTAILSQIAGAVIAGGAVLVASGWFAGPAKVAIRARQAIAPFLREQPLATHAIALTVLVLIFVWNPIYATGTPAGIIIFTVLTLLGTETLRRQTMREFAPPPASSQPEPLAS
jgi:predicted phage tail protein